MRVVIDLDRRGVALVRHDTIDSPKAPRRTSVSRYTALYLYAGAGGVSTPGLWPKRVLSDSESRPVRYQIYIEIRDRPV